MARGIQRLRKYRSSWRLMPRARRDVSSPTLCFELCVNVRRVKFPWCPFRKMVLRLVERCHWFNGLALTVELCWQFAGANRGRGDGQSPGHLQMRRSRRSRLVFGPDARCRHLEGGMFTWDRTSVLGCRTDGRAGFSGLKLHPSLGHICFMIPPFFYSEVCFNRSVAKRVFQSPAPECLFVFLLVAPFPSL